MSRHRIAAAALVALVTALPALAADVTGKWTSEFDTQVGVQKFVARRVKP